MEQPSVPPRPSLQNTLLGRAAELDRLRRALTAEQPPLVLIEGPRGTGKTSLVCAALQRTAGPVVYLEAAPLEGEPLRRALEMEARRVLPDLELPERPDLLPLPASGREWIRLIEGILISLGAGRERGILVLDGLDSLVRARRRLPAELADAWGRARRGAVSGGLVLVTRDRPAGPEYSPDGGLEPDTRIALGGLPYRAAGWAQGALDPDDAFARWTVFGAHPAHLANAEPGESLEDAVVRRILDPDGALYEAPLRRLEAVVQAPARYAGILQALAQGDRDWGEIAGRLGSEAGNRLAPYVRRLEAEGLVRVRRPLDARPGSRNRRYGAVDPFYAFWFALVLPNRSLLRVEGPRRVWREKILPGLQGHRDRWLPEAARQWLRSHAAELFPASAREVGSLWGEGPELEVAGRLGNGQVCYGVCQRGRGAAGEELLAGLADRMAESRYGLGREARAPLVFVQGRVTEGLRRHIARDPLARVVDPGALMGLAPARSPAAAPEAAGSRSSTGGAE